MKLIKILSSYTWEGSYWQPGNSMVAGLGNFGSYSAPTVFQKDGTLYLVTGTESGEFYGFRWTGAQWVSDSAIVSGLSPTESHSTPRIFSKDGIWRLISGAEGTSSSDPRGPYSYQDFHGYQWTGAQWVSDSAIISGLGDVGERTSPTVFSKDGIWHLITGRFSSVSSVRSVYNFPSGFNWTGTNWQPDSGIIAGLGQQQHHEVFQKDETWYFDGNFDGNFDGPVPAEDFSLIAGYEDGSFAAYDWRIRYIKNLSIDLNSDSTKEWSMTGELNSTNSPRTIDLDTTVIQNYVDNKPADTDGFIYVPITLKSASAGIVQLDALSVRYYSSGTLTPLPEGEYNVTVYANDTAGNMNSSTIYFTVGTPPQITITSPQNTVYASSSVDLNYSVTDESGIDWVGYSLDGQDNVTLMANTALIGLGDGTHNIAIYANDTFGNINSSMGHSRIF